MTTSAHTAAPLAALLTGVRLGTITVDDAAERIADGIARLQSVAEENDGHAKRHAWNEHELRQEIETLRDTVTTVRLLQNAERQIARMEEEHRDERAALRGQIEDVRRRLQQTQRENADLDRRIWATYCTATTEERRKAAQPTKYDQVPDGCWVACIAGITGLPHEELIACMPSAEELAQEKRTTAAEYHNAVNKYLRQHRWRLAYIGPDVPMGYAIGSGIGPRGHYHSVITRDGMVWHDPHESRAGIRRIEQFEVLIPLDSSPEAPHV